MSPSLGARLLRQGRQAGRQSSAPHPALQSLTRRETAILRELAKGRSNKEIARILEIEEKTVKNHMTRVFSKLGVTSRVEAALIQREGVTAGETGT